MTNLIPAVQLIDGHPRVSSLSISEHFEKRHADVLNSVRKIALECTPEFSERNFSLADFPDEQGKLRPMYQLSRDGFTLVAMGFTGKKALAWKVRYIEAFNAMERALIEGAHGEPVSIPPTASTAADRAPLRSLVHAWAQVAGQPHQALWPQVKAHFQLSRIDDLPVEWIPDALAFVQSKIDALPKALPEAPELIELKPLEFSEPDADRYYTAVREDLEIGLRIFSHMLGNQFFLAKSFRVSQREIGMRAARNVQICINHMHEAHNSLKEANRLVSLLN